MTTRMGQAFAGLLMAATSLGALAGEATLAVMGNGSYVTLGIPMWVQSQTRLADLRDLHVLNARGEALPYAWADALATVSTQQVNEQAVPFFKAPRAASAVEPSQQGGWIVDARRVKGRITALQLTLPAGANGIYGFALESSSDLQHWRTERAAVQLLSLEHQGLHLDNTRIELDDTAGIRAGYLRLRPLPDSAPPPLTGVTVSSVQQDIPPTPLQWSEVLSPTSCTSDHCDYLLPRHVPLERLEVQLANVNTLAPVDVLVLDEPGSAAPVGERRHRHHLREQLKGLRQKSEPPVTPNASTSDAGWYGLDDFTAYWLRLPQGEVRSPALWLDGGTPHAQLRLKPRGGMASLGSPSPRIRIGSRTRTLVFLAREPEPYRIAWGGEPGNVLTLSQLMPTRQAGDPLPDSVANVWPPMAPPPAATPAPAPGLAPVPDPRRKLWLWGALLLALGAMGAMAWSLLRPRQPPA